MIYDSYMIHDKSWIHNSSHEYHDSVRSRFRSFCTLVLQWDTPQVWEYSSPTYAEVTTTHDFLSRFNEGSENIRLETHSRVDEE